MKTVTFIFLSLIYIPAMAESFEAMCARTKTICWTEYPEKKVNVISKKKAAPIVPVIAYNKVKSKPKVHRVNDDEITRGRKKIKGQTARDIECLAYSMYREAGNQELKDQYAVGQVHINRLLTGTWGTSMCQVVYAKAQFSWTLLPKKAPTWSNFDRSIYMTLAENMMVDGYHVKSLASTDVLHYHADYVNPNWAKKSQVVATAGAHIFYRGIAH